MFYLRIDKREKKVINWLKNREIEFTEELLDIGDIIISRKGINVNTVNGMEDIFVIERKTVDDMLSSVKDGRYREQKARLSSHLINNNCKGVFYILEGFIDKYSKPSEKKTIYGAWISCQFRDKLNVIRTMNIGETCEFCLRLLDRLSSNPSEIISGNVNSSDSIPSNKDEGKKSELSYLKTLKTKKKDNLTPKMCQILALATIPGISTSIAEIIIKKYDGLNKIFKCYNNIDIKELCEEDKEKEKGKLLSELKINDKRKLGISASRNIYNYLIKNKFETI